MIAKQEELATRKDLEKLENRLTTQIGANAAKIDANAAIINRVERNLGAKIDANSSKIDSLAGSLTRLTSIVLENREQMATKEEMNKRLDQIVTGQDKMVQLYMNLDQERVATMARVDRLQGDMQQNRTRIEDLETKVAR